MDEPSEKVTGGEAAAPTSQRAVRDELEALLASRTLSQSESLKRFIRHVVEAELEGRGDELKEFILGSEVFGRGVDYDPRIDPIVRVQATRLRGKLAEYYQDEGLEAPVAIELPKGSYVPRFRERRSGADEKRAAQTGPSGPKSRSATSWLVWALGAATLLLALVGLWWLRSSDSASDVEVRSVAVLPFSDMSPDGDHQFYGDGLADEITTTLASLGGVEVAPRTSTFRFKESSEDLKTIGSELSVDAVLQGSVRRFDDRLRVSVQLIRVDDGKQIWSENYDRADVEAFAVHDEIAGSVAHAVRGSLVEAASRPADSVPAGGAYEDYLRGRFERERNTPAALERSITLFEGALDKDPDYAPAYAGLVQAYALSSLWGLSSPGQTRGAAREAAEHAVALDSDHPEAFAAAAAYELLYEWNVGEAESILDLGLRRSPESVELLLMRALAHASRGRLAAAREDIDEAVRHSPNHPLAHHLRASMDFHSGAYVQAAEECRSLLEWAPDYPLSWLLLSRSQARLGRFGEASETLDTFERLAGEGALVVSHRAVLRALENRVDDARALLQQIDALGRDSYVPPMLRARARASLGETELALGDIERAYEERSLSLLWLSVDPDFASLGDEPRFQAIAGRFTVD